MVYLIVLASATSATRDQTTSKGCTFYCSWQSAQHNVLLWEGRQRKHITRFEELEILGTK